MRNSSPSDLLAQALELADRHMLRRTSSAPRSEVSTKALRRSFGLELPDDGCPPEEVIDLLANAAEPGLMGNTGSNFFGWVMGASTPVGIAADILTSCWGQNAAIYQTSPSAAVAEETAASWLLDVLDLPDESSVGFTTGATMASFICLAAARAEVLRIHNWDLEAEGLMGAPPINIVISEEAHASILAVLKYLGFGARHFIRIPTDDQGRMEIHQLEYIMGSLSGPTIVVAQAGHINSGAFDDLEQIGKLTRKQNAWFHIDGAFGLWARSTRLYRHLTNGAELADSWAVDGHKWLQVPYDSGYAIVKHEDAHRHAMNISASYLNREDSDGRNPSEYGPELSRRARGFTTWAVMQSMGRTGLKQMVERHCQCAKQLAGLLEKVDGIRVLNDVVLNQVAITFSAEKNPLEPVKWRSGSPHCHELTDAVILAVQKENQAFVSGADWRGHRIMRVSVIAENTDKNDIDALATSIIRAWKQVQRESDEVSAAIPLSA